MVTRATIIDFIDLLTQYHISHYVQTQYEMCVNEVYIRTCITQYNIE